MSLHTSDIHVSSSLDLSQESPGTVRYFDQIIEACLSLDGATNAELNSYASHVYKKALENDVQASLYDYASQANLPETTSQGDHYLVSVLFTEPSLKELNDHCGFKKADQIEDDLRNLVFAKISSSPNFKLAHRVAPFTKGVLLHLAASNETEQEIWELIAPIKAEIIKEARQIVANHFREVIEYIDQQIEIRKTLRDRAAYTEVEYIQRLNAQSSQFEVSKKFLASKLKDLSRGHGLSMFEGVTAMSFEASDDNQVIFDQAERFLYQSLAALEMGIDREKKAQGIDGTGNYRVIGDSTASFETVPALDAGPDHDARSRAQQERIQIYDIKYFLYQAFRSRSKLVEEFLGDDSNLKNWEFLLDFDDDLDDYTLTDKTGRRLRKFTYFKKTSEYTAARSKDRFIDQKFSHPWFDTINVADIITKYISEESGEYREHLDSVRRLKEQIEATHDAAEKLRLVTQLRVALQRSPKTSKLTHHNENEAPRPEARTMQGAVDWIINENRNGAMAIFVDAISFGGQNKVEQEKRLIEAMNHVTGILIEDLAQNSQLYLDHFASNPTIIRNIREILRLKETGKSARELKWQTQILLLASRDFIIGYQTDEAQVSGWIDWRLSDKAKSFVEQSIIRGCDPLTIDFNDSIDTLANKDFRVAFLGGDEALLLGEFDSNNVKDFGEMSYLVYQNIVSTDYFQSSLDGPNFQAIGEELFSAVVYEKGFPEDEEEAFRNRKKECIPSAETLVSLGQQVVSLYREEQKTGPRESEVFHEAAYFIIAEIARAERNIHDTENMRQWMERHRTRLRNFMIFFPELGSFCSKSEQNRLMIAKTLDKLEQKSEIWFSFLKPIQAREMRPDIDNLMMLADFYSAFKEVNHMSYQEALAAA